MKKQTAVSLVCLAASFVGGHSIAQEAPPPGAARPRVERSTPGSRAAAPADGPWCSWRGPHQDGTSREGRFPSRVSLEGADGSWSIPLPGRGTPVIARGRLFTMAFQGEGQELLELLVCLDAASGERIWQYAFTEFLTDITYSRFAIGSPTVDLETQQIYCMSSAGLLSCFDWDGRLVWQHSLMSEHGRLSFPNGRTGAPLVDEDQVVIHVITSGWGPNTQASDRFFAFDKRSGLCRWSSTPGSVPKDSSFCFPVVAEEKGRRVAFAGLGDGQVVCVDVRTGDPVWRFPLATGGVNSSLLLHGDKVIAIHDKENLDNSLIGRMVAIKRSAMAEPGQPGLVLGATSEVWRNDLGAFTSSPVLVGDRVYVTTNKGDLCCVDAESGKVLWEEKLAPDQIHASPVYGDGKLYVPMTNGTFHIVRPKDAAPEVLQQVQLEGNCLGAPALAHGKVFVHTTLRLYCFAGDGQASEEKPAPAVRLQVVPADHLGRVGERIKFTVRSLDARGRVVSPDVGGWAFKGLPAGWTLKDTGELAVMAEGAGALEATAGDLRGTARLRVVAALPYAIDFEQFELKPHPSEPGISWAPPPASWIGVLKKWEVRDLDGGKVLARTMDIPILQRTMSFIGHPDTSGCTVTADVYADGNRRSMATGGVVNQRYLFVLKGNHQELEISSNMEVLKESVPFKFKPKTWYRLKTWVEVFEDGTGIVRAKAWERGQPEPDVWTLEVKHTHAHKQGAPGIFGFTPQNRVRVYLDNISVTPHE